MAESEQNQLFACSWLDGRALYDMYVRDRKIRRCVARAEERVIQLTMSGSSSSRERHRERESRGRMTSPSEREQGDRMIRL